MLFINFLCLLYLMVISTSHTISKSIDTDDAIDEVVDTVINLDNNRHQRSRHDRVRHKFRIRETSTKQLNEDIRKENTDPTLETSLSKPTTIACKNKHHKSLSSTSEIKPKSKKRKLGNFWKKFRKEKPRTTIRNVRKRQMVKNYKYGWLRYVQHQQPTFIERERDNKRNNMQSQYETSERISITIPIQKKNNNVKFLLPTQVMYSKKGTKDGIKEIENSNTKSSSDDMFSAIEVMGTHINQLKELYGVSKLAMTPSGRTTASAAYPMTADIEELLTRMKMKVIQTMADSDPSIANIVSNTVTETTFGVGIVDNHMSSSRPQFEPALTENDYINNKVDMYDVPHNLDTRSLSSPSLSNIEERLQKEIKDIYNKVKAQVSNEIKKHTTGPMPIQSDTSEQKTTTKPISTIESKSPSISKKKISSKTKQNAASIKPEPQEKGVFQLISSPEQPKDSEKPSSLNKLSTSATRRLRDGTPSANSTTEEPEATSDDYSLLSVYEEMLEKVKEDNSMRLMATASLPSNLLKKGRYRLSKRNPETLTDIELQESVNTLYDDGVMMPDDDYINSMPTSSTSLDDDQDSTIVKSTKSYEELSKKIAYDDFVNGYKHYLKFQKENAKADNFSAIVKYQAHRHHNVDDIGKYILDKIPQIPQNTKPENETYRKKRFFEDVDIEDQEVSTKTDDSWFRKHFYVFLDYGPPKKFHKSEIIALKSPLSDASTDALLQTTSAISFIPSSSSSDTSTESIVQANLDSLTKSLDTVKSSTLNAFVNSAKAGVLQSRKEGEISTQDVTALPTKLMYTLEKSKTCRETKVTTKRKHSKIIADRHKRANESIVDEFNMKGLEDKSTTPIKELTADVAVTVNQKSQSKPGYVDVNLVPLPTHTINLHVNHTKARKSKIRDFLKRFHLKSKKPNSKGKRSCTNRLQKINPFESIKKMFKPDTPEATTKKSRIKMPMPTVPDPFEVSHSKLKMKSTIKTTASTMHSLDNDLDELQHEEDRLQYSNRLYQPTDENFKSSDKTIKTDKPITIVMILDDSKSKTLKQPIMSTSRERKPSKKPRIPISKRIGNDVMLFSVKPLRPVRPAVKPLFTAGNDSLPDVNLEITKVRYGTWGHNGLEKVPDLRHSMFYFKKGEHSPYVRSLIEGLAYKNQRVNLRRNEQLDKTSSKHEQLLERSSRTPSSTMKLTSNKNIDYFNDLLTWDNDVLDIDEVTQWTDTVKNDLGTPKFTTPNKEHMMQQIKEMYKSLRQPSNIPLNLLRFNSNNKQQNYNEEVSMDETTSDVTNKDILRKEEPKYFKYYKPKQPINNQFQIPSPTTPLDWVKPKPAANFTIAFPTHFNSSPFKYLHIDEPPITFPVNSSLISSEKHISWTPAIKKPEPIWKFESPIKWTTAQEHEHESHKATEDYFTKIAYRLILGSPNLKENSRVTRLTLNDAVGLVHEDGKPVNSKKTSKPNHRKYIHAKRPLKSKPGKTTRFNKYRTSKKPLKFNSTSKTDFNDFRKEYDVKDTPALMVDTTLLSYDDEVETVTNGIDVKKLTRNPQNMIQENHRHSHTGHKSLVNVVAKTNKKPQMYYSTPLPMKPSAFKKFLEEQGMGVESVTSPIYGATTLFNSISTPKSYTSNNMKGPVIGSLMPKAQHFTKLSSILSKYTLSIANKKHQSTLAQKTKVLNEENIKYSVRTKPKIINIIYNHHVSNKRSYYEDLGTNKRIKKLFAMKTDSTTLEPKTEKEDKFSPELQTKLEHLAEPKTVEATKSTTPKTNPYFVSNFRKNPKCFQSHKQKFRTFVTKAIFPTLSSTAPPTKISSETPKDQLTTSLQTEKQTFETETETEVEKDDSIPNAPLDIGGSIIFTNENSQNKEIDITIINFDDMTTNNEEFYNDTKPLPKNYYNFNDTSTTELLKEEHFDAMISDDKSSTTESLYEEKIVTMVLDSSINELTREDIVNDSSPIEIDASSKKVYAEDLTQRFSNKELNNIGYLDQEPVNQPKSPGKRLEINTHHYKFDIYKNIDNAIHKREILNKSELFFIDEQPQMQAFSILSVTPSIKDLTAWNTRMNQMNSMKKDENGNTFYRTCRNPNRRLVTAERKFGYVRDGKTHLKRMATDLRTNKPASKTPALAETQASTTTKEPSKDTVLTLTDLEETKSICTYTYKQGQPIKLLHTKNKNNVVDDKKKICPDEGFTIQIGHQKIIDAVDKINALKNQEDIQETYDIGEIIGKYGLPHKVHSEEDDFNSVLPSSHIKQEKESEFRFITPSPIQDDTSEGSVQNPTVGHVDSLNANDLSDTSSYEDESPASIKFEQSIFNKSMYGKTTFDVAEFEKAIFHKPNIVKPKTESKTSRIFNDIMSYDIRPDEPQKDKDVTYDYNGMLPDHVVVDGPNDVNEKSNEAMKDKHRNYVFDSASIIYNKPYAPNLTNKPAVRNGIKRDDMAEKAIPLGNTLSVLFRNPLEGHFGFGLKPVLHNNQPIITPKPSQGMTLQMTPMPTPMELLQAQISHRQMGWPQMSPYQNPWAQMQLAPMGFAVYNDTYGIYMEPGILNYDFNQSFAPDDPEELGAYHSFRSKKKNSKASPLKEKNEQLKHTSTAKGQEIASQMPKSTLLNRLEDTAGDYYFKICFTTTKPLSTKLQDSVNSKDSVPIHSNPIEKTIQHHVKRDVQAQDTYTAKDVAALEVIVDLMKNTLAYEEKDLGSTTKDVIHGMKYIYHARDSTNAIQVHIAIPYDTQDSKKRSALEPVRVRKVFSAKMFTPVDLEYQVHSFEGTVQTPTSSTITDNGLSPGMYLLVDKPKSGYALKPLKTNLDFSELKSRQATSLIPLNNNNLTDYKSDTTLQNNNMMNIAKVTLSKDFISAVSKQLVELYDNLTKGNSDESHNMRIRRDMSEETTIAMNEVTKTYMIRRSINWEALKRYFGYGRLCNCKCKPNKPMCRACAASDAVIEEVIFEFDNLGKYMQDHCTEIQTYFWMNPSGGLKLRDTVDRIDKSLHDYARRTKGKCRGRTCEALGNHIDKRQFVKTTKIEPGTLMQHIMDNLNSAADDVDKISQLTSFFNGKLVKGGQDLIYNINSCITLKEAHKRSENEITKKKFVKNVYSLDNINVNIICNPEISTTSEAYETSTTRNLLEMTSAKPQDNAFRQFSSTLFYELDNLKHFNKRKGLKRFFLKRNNKNSNFFTYYTTDNTSSSKIPAKRSAEQIALNADTGATFWSDYLRERSTNDPQYATRPMSDNEPEMNVNVLQTNENAINSKEIDIAYPYSNCTTLGLDENNNATTTTESSNNLDVLLNHLLDHLHNIDNKNQDLSIFSQTIGLQQSVKIKSVRPTIGKVSSSIKSYPNKFSTNSSENTRKLSVETSSISPTNKNYSTTYSQSKAAGGKDSVHTSNVLTTSTKTSDSSNTDFNVTTESTISQEMQSPTPMFQPDIKDSTTFGSDETYEYTLASNSSATFYKNTEQIPFDITTTLETPNTKILMNTQDENKMTKSSTEKIPPKDFTEFQKRILPHSDTASTFPQSKSEDMPSTPIETIQAVPSIPLSVLLQDIENVLDGLKESLMSTPKILTQAKFDFSPFFTRDQNNKDHPHYTYPYLLSNNPENKDTSIHSEFDVIDPFEIIHNTEEVITSETISPALKKSTISHYTYKMAAEVKNVNVETNSDEKLDQVSIFKEPTNMQNTEKTRIASNYQKATITPLTTVTARTTLARTTGKPSTTGSITTSLATTTSLYTTETVASTTIMPQTTVKIEKMTPKPIPTPTTISQVVYKNPKAIQFTPKANTPKQGFFQRITSGSTLLGLTQSFLGLSKRNTITEQPMSTESMQSLLEMQAENVQPQYGSPTDRIDDYDRFVEENVQKQKVDDLKNEYKNVLLSVIQYETNKLNSEWQKIAYDNNEDFGYKRSVDQAYDKSWKAAVRTKTPIVTLASNPGLPDMVTKKGLLNKLYSRMGLAAVKKKAAHTSSSNFSISPELPTVEASTDETMTSPPILMTTDVVGLERGTNNINTKKTVSRLQPKNNKQTTEACHVNLPSHKVCDLKATFSHVIQLHNKLDERNFESYVRNFTCYKYRSLQPNFMISHQTKTPKWDWIRNKRSLKRWSKPKNSAASLFIEKFERFVKDDDGIYRMIDRRKRDAGKSLDHLLRNLPPIQSKKSELIAMFGDTVTLDCPLQPQRSPYSEYTWGADPKSLLDLDNVHIEGFMLVIKKAEARNMGRYSCSVDDVVCRSTKVLVLALPVIDAVFLLTYEVPRHCNYNDLKAIQKLDHEMSKAARCGNLCSIRIDEAMCTRDATTDRSLIRSTGVLTMSPRRVRCSVQCRRDLFSSMLRLAIANIPSVVNTRVVLFKDGFNETLKPYDHGLCRMPTITHSLRKKDSSGHFVYHKFQSAAQPGQVNLVTICNPGFYLMEDQHICAPCPANTSASLGDNVCAPCAAGTSAPRGAAACRDTLTRTRRYDWWWRGRPGWCGLVVVLCVGLCACGALSLLAHVAYRPAHPPCGATHHTYLHSQETRFELWKERNRPPVLPDIDFDIDTS